MGYIQYAPEKVLDVLPLGLPGQVADKNPVVHWLPLQHKTAGMRSEIHDAGSATMGKRLIPVSDLEFSVLRAQYDVFRTQVFNSYRIRTIPYRKIVRCPLEP
jgi:hypothetical protein